VFGQEFAKMAEVAGWNVYSSTGKSTCVIETNRNGLVVQMGLGNSSNLDYLGFFTKIDMQIDATDVEVTFGDKILTAVPTMAVPEGYHGGYVDIEELGAIGTDIFPAGQMIVRTNADEYFFEFADMLKALKYGQECVINHTSGDENSDYTDNPGPSIRFE